LSSPDTSSTLHDEAMALADEADALLKQARGLYAQAAWKELKAAELAGDSEPSRSILYRSAAWLELSAGSFERAAWIARRGLDGQPAPRLREELRVVLERAECLQAMNES
jgi:hypothetical protein